MIETKTIRPRSRSNARRSLNRKNNEKTNVPIKDDKSRKSKNDEDEDLEEFYNKLKQKAANKQKK
jgi:hypothetical protein